MDEYGRSVRSQSAVAAGGPPSSDAPSDNFNTRSSQVRTTTEPTSIFVTAKGKKKGYDTLEKTVIFVP